MTIRGRWINVSGGSYRWTVPRLVDSSLVDPILPYLPTAEVSKELLELSFAMDVSVPREISAPLITALNEFASAADEIYRMNASRLDNAHDIMAHSTDLRFGKLPQISGRLLEKGLAGQHLNPQDPPEYAKYAVRRAILRAGIKFGVDHETHRTGMFQIRSHEQVQVITKVQKWLRDYREAKISQVTADGSFNPAFLETEDGQGVSTVAKFIRKSIRLIYESRKLREPTNVGYLGPSKERFPLDSPLGTIRHIVRDVFTSEEKLIIRFIEFWSLQDLYHGQPNLQALCPLILRETGLYNDVSLMNQSGLMFLMEIGVLEPHINRVLFDVNLLLPSSQHSRPLENLATNLEKVDPAKVHLPDAMASLRHDFKELPVFCIDNAGAEEIDDGISVERILGSSDTWVHIHIANPTAFFDQQAIYAKMAAHLTETFYSPDSVYPMLPKWMSRDMFSLRADRPTLTFSAKLDPQGEILDFKIRNGIIRKVVTLTYKDLPILLGVDEKTSEIVKLVIGGEGPKETARKTPDLTPEQLEDLRRIHSLSSARYLLRRRNGGVYFQHNGAEVTVHQKEGKYGLLKTYPHRGKGLTIQGDPVIVLHGRPYANWFSPSRSNSSEHLVREMMILACEVGGRYAVDRNVPSIFRGMQSNPYAKYTAAEFERDVVLPAEAKFGEIPLAVGIGLLEAHGYGHVRTSAIRHPLMGLDQYSQVTSPLRRYGDMIIHWQIESALREESLGGKRNIRPDKLTFNETHMASNIEALRPRERMIRKAKRLCENHWKTLFFFRAYNFGELPESILPKRFNIVIEGHSAGRFTQQMNTVGAGVVLGQKVVVRGEDNADFMRTTEVGDTWEVEKMEIQPFPRTFLVKPIRLVEKGHDMAAIIDRDSRYWQPR